MKELNIINGHILLYCKNHYKVPNVDFLTGLRRIWAIRCGLENQYTEDKGADRYIANSLFKLLQELIPQKMDYFHEFIHEQLERSRFDYEGLNALETLIVMYRSELAMLSVREQRGKKWFNLVKLPNPKKRVFKRIISGKGKYEDYKLIN